MTEKELLDEIVIILIWVGNGIWFIAGYRIGRDKKIDKNKEL